VMMSVVTTLTQWVSKKPISSRATNALGFPMTGPVESTGRGRACAASLGSGVVEEMTDISPAN